MLQIPRWQIFLVLAVCVFGLLLAFPNFVSKEGRDVMRSFLPGFFPVQTVNLGLDLQGGAYLLLEVETDVVVRERAEELVQLLRPELRKERIGYLRLTALPEGVRIQLREEADLPRVRRMILGIEPDLQFLETDSGILEARMTEQIIKEIVDLTLQQSQEIVRRRLDETGTREITVQRQGEDRIIVQIPGLDDPARIRELLGRTARLGFHMVSDNEAGRGIGARVLPFANQEEGRNLPVERQAIITGDMLTNAQPAFDQGQPIVTFRLNAIGARKFCDVSTNNIGRPFAIVLDNQIISAPVIRDAICGGAGQISGGFTVQEANDLSLLLRAGALPAPLTILEERSVGPSLGADSIESGKLAGIMSILLVFAFMGVRYRLFGLFASVALLINMMLTFALLTGLQATLTLPGIAGIVLTIGMAVDANVLIFERIREEFRKGRSPVAAINSGYGEAMSSIIDANLTTLIAAGMLYAFGTGPIKGFAVTLTFGVATSLFTAIMVTRLMILVWLKKFRPSRLPV